MGFPPRYCRLQSATDIAEIIGRGSDHRNYPPGHGTDVADADITMLGLLHENGRLPG
jgi:hypothetical protein